MQPNGQQSQSTIANIFSRSFPGQNLFDVSLVKDNNDQLPHYKPRYFFFLSMTPSEVNQQTGQRTYNRQAKVNIKTDTEKILAFAHTIRVHARGQGERFGNFAIFTDPSKTNFNQGDQNYKSCYVSSFVEKNTQQQKIAISVKVGKENRPVGIAFSIPEALAMADMFEFFGNKALELEYEAKTLSVGKPQSAPSNYQQNQNYQQNHQPQQNNMAGGNQVQDNFADALNQQSNGGGPAPSENTGPFIDDAPF
ncbi:MAG: hypothetical protein ACOC1O_02055 [bacterium]